ncbi:hypothetical protein [Fonticella tunisiensis]|uniref:Uncharacterized protein n=1 Tax=Fonticella tunisiensis TaxID=1096341 RepID=A0A4R7KL65_9CLOT|nr:hypothetical protein [Fonticella tunisiensis]TDT57300.1 hypothetical protein EDD71_11282 [Fonticella tunisiensis]
MELVLDEQRDNDIYERIEGITFVIEANHRMYFENIEIIYNPEVFNNGFYVHMIDKI